MILTLLMLIFPICTFTENHATNTQTPVPVPNWMKYFYVYILYCFQIHQVNGLNNSGKRAVSCSSPRPRQRQTGHSWLVHSPSTTLYQKIDLNLSTSNQSY